MKKVVALMLVLAMALCLFAGCSSKPASNDAPAADNTQTDTQTPATPDTSTDETTDSSDNSDKTIAILMHSVADEFIYTVYQSAEARAQELGYKTVFYDANHDAAVQASTINDCIQQGVAAIMLCPQDAAALSDSVKEINDAGIPVTLVDRTVDEGNYVALCQSDNYEFGRQGAEQILAAAEKAGIAKEDLKILELQGDLATTSGLDRSNGFQDACKELGLNIVSSLPTKWETDVAYNAALDGMQANPDINAIFLASDGVMGDAVVSALEQINRLVPAGEDGHIIITAVDGTPGVLTQIRNGNVDATCAQPAIEMAKTAIDKLDAALKGEVALDANEDCSLPPVIGTIDNVDSDALWANQK